MLVPMLLLVVGTMIAGEDNVSVGSVPEAQSDQSASGATPATSQEEGTGTVQENPPAEPPGKQLEKPKEERPKETHKEARQTGKSPGWAERYFVGLHGAGFIPYGYWTEHVYAGETLGDTRVPRDLTQFGPGGGGILELGLEMSKRYFLALQLDLTSLTTGDWEAFASSVGSDVSVLAMQWDATLVAGVRIVHYRPFRLEARICLGYMHVWGQEENRDYDRSYVYSFAGAAFVAKAGLSVSFELTKSLDLVLMTDQTVGLPGVRYPEEQLRPYLGLTCSLGFRFWPGRRVGGENENQ